MLSSCWDKKKDTFKKGSTYFLFFLLICVGVTLLVDKTLIFFPYPVRLKIALRTNHDEERDSGTNNKQKTVVHIDYNNFFSYFFIRNYHLKNYHFPFLFASINAVLHLK